MVHTKLGAGDWVALSRIFLSFVFLLSFRSETGAGLTLAIASAVAAQVTDHLDGYLAKRLNHVSVLGWAFDSYADRAFYVAAILAFEREYSISELIVWLFVLRELAFYALRILIGDFRLISKKARPLALIHAGVVRIAIAVGCIVPLQIMPPKLETLAVTGIQGMIGIATLLGFMTFYWLLKTDARAATH